MTNKISPQQQAQVRIELEISQQMNKLFELKSRLESLIAELQDSLFHLNEGHPERLNSLGIVQGQGLEIDRLIAEIRLNAKWLASMKALYDEMGKE